MALFTGWKLVPQTDLWVRLHSDVQWHREWQDAHSETERTRVVNLYRELAERHPEDGNWAYLAARALPAGEEQRDT